MKKKMMRGACMLTSLFLLGEPLSLQAAEVNSDSTYDTQTEENTAELLKEGLWTGLEKTSE